MARPRADTLTVRQFGPIDEVTLDLADLTLLVGPQGTGKSIALQLFKLTQDRLTIAKTARDNGLVWGSVQEFLDMYLGGGIGSSWTDDSELSWRGRSVSLPPQNRRNPSPPWVFYVPAQRALTIADGWPLAFTSYRSAPYVVRAFGLQLQRILLGAGADTIFPSPAQLKAGLRNAIDRSVFHSGTLALQQHGLQRELRLLHGTAELPYMAWSAGQREFVPLLLALYDLLPASAKTKRDDVGWVILEEPEMGLHPEAIVAVGALVLELLHRGYRVILSTHHPLMLDIVWLIRELQRCGAATPRDLLRAFGLDARGDNVQMATSVLSKECRVYNLHHGEHGVIARDISSLDPGDEDPAISGWGGLTGVSEQFHEQLARVLERSDRT
ncbi:AAA family ATPase [Haliangium sp.]|uniref:AAA family ATPase n=1 Tax=Haliangium sp. TaxID=2663208 RepID=UPI003D141D3B